MDENDPDKPSSYQYMFGEYRYESIFNYVTFLPFMIKRSVIIALGIAVNTEPNVYLMGFVVVSLVVRKCMLNDL